MSEILNVLDVNDYGLQSMKASGGGGEAEDLTIELGAQDTALSTQQSKIDELESALNNKIALDLADATSDADATAGDIAKNKTAYVNGVKLVGSADIGGYKLPKGATFNGAKNLVTLPTDIDVSEITNMNNMFGGIVSFKTLDLSKWDTSNVTDMSYMFHQAYYLASVDMSNIDTSNVTNMSNMFRECSVLENININNINTINVENFYGMFYKCKKLANVSLIVANLDTSNATNLGSMFINCTSLTAIDLSSWNTSKNKELSYMFSGCSNLVDVNVDNLSATVTTYDNTPIQNIFNGCTSLSNNSLNSILKMCTNITATAGKTLANIGLTQAQAETCQTLSNWNAFVAAGWTSRILERRNKKCQQEQIKKEYLLIMKLYQKTMQI